MTISATTQGLRPGVCTSTSRPSTPFDGMMIYETDTNRVAVYDSTAWVYKTPDTTVGAVLQVVSTAKTNTFSTTSTSYTDITGMSVTITPKFSNSAVLVICSINIGSDGGGPITGVKMVRGSTDIFIGDADGVKSRGSIGPRIDFEYQMFPGAMCFLDSPSTTSAIAYKLQMKTSSGTSYVNRIHNALDGSGVVRGASSITVMEIAG